jgi:hypothetical protein
MCLMLASLWVTVGPLLISASALGEE